MIMNRTMSTIFMTAPPLVITMDYPITSGNDMAGIENGSLKKLQSVVIFDGIVKCGGIQACKALLLNKNMPSR